MVMGLPALLFFLFAVVICAYDLKERRIPDVLSMGGAAVILLLRVAVAPGDLPGLAAVGAGVGGLFYAVWYLTASLGRGDAKFGFLLVTGLGAHRWLAALLIGTLAALAWMLVAEGRTNRRGASVPLAPFLAAGAALAHVLLREAPG